MVQRSYGASGPWYDVSDRFLGLRFSFGGQTHLGWAELDVSSRPGNIGGTITFLGYAYETVPNQAILAGQTSEATPEPATLGLLALGSLDSASGGDESSSQ